MRMHHHVAVRTFSSAVLAAIFLALTPGQTQAANVVSNIASLNGREVMMVDGKPFFYNGVQTSFFRLSGWNWTEYGEIFKTARNDGFTVIGIVERWRDIEPIQNQFIWKDLDSALISCVKHGIKMEILWFGSDVCTKQEATPDWVRNGPYQAVLNSAGQVVINTRDNLPKLDKTDTLLLAKEMQSLTAMMNHIRSFLDEHSYPNVLVGVQVINEPTVIEDENARALTDRSYSAYANKMWQEGGYPNTEAFNTRVMWRYLNGLAKAVKTSNYPVWTRHNRAGLEGYMGGAIIDMNESEKLNGASYLDFIGADYVQSLDGAFHYGKNPYFANKGHNLPMIMENSGELYNIANVMFCTYAGGAVHHIWEIHDPWGVYSVSGHQLVAKDNHTAAVRQMAVLLRKNWPSLASQTVGSDSLNYFMKLHYTGNYVSTIVTAYEDTKTITGIPVRFATTNSGTAFVSARGNHLYFQSTTTSRFAVPSSLARASLEKGYCDSAGTWVSQGAVASEVNASEMTFTIDAYDCLRLARSTASRLRSSLPSSDRPGAVLRLSNGVLRAQSSDGVFYMMRGLDVRGRAGFSSSSPAAGQDTRSLAKGVYLVMVSANGSSACVKRCVVGGFPVR